VTNEELLARLTELRQLRTQWIDYRDDVHLEIVRLERKIAQLLNRPSFLSL